LLAIASKNNPAEALEVLRHHPGMVLREQDFSAVRINWRPKAANLRSIAEELSIGLDSLVFVDDNPLERELVRKEHPNLLVVDLPADPALYRGALEKVVQLQPLSVTAEDSNRVQMYRTAERRREALSSASSLEDHLKSLQIVLELGLAAEADLERVRQLFLKTNQFNTTTRRYSQQDVRSFCEGSRHRLYVGRARDRFGDHGLVTVAVVATLGSTWKIESFLMSCRVIGYGIETAMLTEIQADARTSGAVELEGEWIETVKNAPARELFPASGFTVVGKQGESLWYRRSLAEHCAPAPAWIEVVRK
jgi:FkbH-like protein